MYLLQKTCCRTKALKSSSEPVSPAAICVPSTSGNPTDGGVSGSINQMTIATTTAMAAGTKKQSRQPATTRYPQSRTIRMLPMLWEEFQIENFVVSCLGGN